MSKTQRVEAGEGKVPNYNKKEGYNILAVNLLPPPPGGHHHSEAWKQVEKQTTPGALGTSCTHGAMSGMPSMSE